VKTVAAIRHVHFEDLGALESVLSGAGYEIRYHEAGIDDLQSPQLANCELLAVLGGPIGVYEEEKYPFIKDEITVIEKRLNFGRPAIGICLGAQLFARALGFRVYAGPGKEIGWAPITLTSAGKHSPLRFLEGVPVLHWHGDTFDLPDGAELLASTSLYRNQAFRYGKSVLAFQFHPEASTKNFERCFDRPCRRVPQHDRDFGPQVALPDSTAGGGVGTPGAAMPSRMAERTRRMQPTLEGVLSSQWLIENMFWGRRREMGCGL
jgi:GMP synthase (glutamine-hydrolysing)